jgi:nucleoside-diphosphate-sugar epimerase
MQTILGANGVIARELAKTLPQYTNEIRLVSRIPKKINKSDLVLSADLTNYEQTLKAVENSEIVYLTVGLDYNIKTWQFKWPLIMQNVINACKKYNAKLVFFDNVYMYGKVEGAMTENTPVNPCSKKGEVRAKIAGMILDEVKQGNIQAIIARAADFYGPKTATSFVNALVFDNLKKGKKAQWMVNVNKVHSFTYTPDAGKATAILGNTPSAFNQVWHLPTQANPLTGKEIINLVAESYGVKPKYMILGKMMLQFAGLFNSIARESVEMLYQYEADYRFDSSNFEKAFNFNPVSYSDGIKFTASE